MLFSSAGFSDRKRYMMTVKMMVLKKKHDKDDEAEKKSTVFFGVCTIVFCFDKEMFVLRGRIGALHQQMKLEQLFNNIDNKAQKYFKIIAKNIRS